VFRANAPLPLPSVVVAATMSTAAVETYRPENWFRHRLSEDMKKITSAAAKLRIHRRKKEEKKQQKQQQLQQQQQQEQQEQQKEQKQQIIAADAKESARTVRTVAQSLPKRIVSVTAIQERKWTLTDYLHSLGVYVQKHCTHLSTIPSATDVAMWVRCADRALQLNGWTVNSFLLESHVVFTYMLLARAFEQFRIHTVADAKELVLMCLYISYTYNANETSYPLRPFLVKHDRVTFWDKCTTLSLSASRSMLRINQDHYYYAQLLASLKSVTAE